MASVRAALKREAMRLAEPATIAEPDRSEVCIPSDAVRRLYALARTCATPEQTLRWAWRSQRRTHSVTGRDADGLATTYLLATMLYVQQVEGGRGVAVPA